MYLHMDKKEAAPVTKRELFRTIGNTLAGAVGFAVAAYVVVVAFALL